jgi:hypothetical protein
MAMDFRVLDALIVAGEFVLVVAIDRDDFRDPLMQLGEKIVLHFGGWLDVEAVGLGWFFVCSVFTHGAFPVKVNKRMATAAASPTGPVKSKKKATAMAKKVFIRRPLRR